MNHCFKLLSMAFAALFTANLPAHAAWYTNSVDADSFVRAAAPTLNYGAAGALSVSGADANNGSGVTNGVFDSFIRFNTAAMVSNFNTLYGTNKWVVNGATLQMTEVGAPANALFNRGTGSFQIRWITNDNWVEGTGNPMAPTTTGICYNNESTLLNSATDANLGAYTNNGVDGTLDFPLALPVNFVNDVQAGGEVGLFLTALDANIGFTMDSKSFGTVSARPYLIISAVPQPAIVNVAISGSNVALTATNGASAKIYVALASTNLSLPLNQWTPVATNAPTTNGNFTVTLTNAWNNAAGQKFFILQTQ